ncbi:hypothetical protein Agabi119p4_8608 [Agaricus bisporus var. burnettii]|uniref:Uncharacterized protein n=1 Tax=Agaricus bisporus var. burnettii TaxID=192524 RepID=A0A8H7EYW9_AGABI|nr:hypothetical protein Agabi119p4_8608 [Agaricus bisporus var. burnettii]
MNQDFELIPSLPPQDARGPGWDKIGRTLAILSEQIPRIAHRHNNFQHQNNDLSTGLNQTIDRMNELDTAAMEQRATRIEAELAAVPMRLLNGTSNNTSRIEYPPPHVPGGALPATKAGAWLVNGRVFSTF